MNRLISLFCIYMLLVSPSYLFAKNKLVFEISTTMNPYPVVVLENNSQQMIELPENLRGLPYLCLVVNDQGELLKDKSWVSAKRSVQTEERWYSGLVYQIEIGQKEYFVPSFNTETISLKTDGCYYMVCIISNIPFSPQELVVSNIVILEVKDRKVKSTKSISRQKIPEIAYSTLQNEIEKIKSEMRSND